MSSPSRLPQLFPPRIYELTYRMLEHAVHAELADLAIIQLTESADTCHMIVDPVHRTGRLHPRPPDRSSLAAIREGHPRLRQPHGPRPRKLR